VSGLASLEMRKIHVISYDIIIMHWHLNLSLWVKFTRVGLTLLTPECGLSFLRGVVDAHGYTSGKQSYSKVAIAGLSNSEELVKTI